ncbi:MAG: S41 family peptidase [Phycisphaerales bacterium]|nr:S41 family peptidase [Phycisphaerales bacterium]
MLSPMLALTLTLTAPAFQDADQAQGGASMYRYPDISSQDIVFVYGNDLWRVPLDGGTALPLASPAGVELMPRFNPDGSQVAFVGNYDGGRDIYTVPVRGGVPQRITHHPSGEVLSDWTNDGDLLFSARSMGTLPMTESPFQVNSEGGLPKQLPVPYGANPVMNKSGTWLAYTPNQRDNRTWKRYRGGMASDIWLVNMETGESKRVTDWEGTDTIPMWHDDELFYLSDAGDEHRLNLWKYNTSNDQHTQLTRFNDYDVKWPAIGPDDAGKAKIVFQRGPAIWVYDDQTKTTKPIDIDVPGATASLRPKMVDTSDFIQQMGISPTAKRAVAEARGDIWTMPAKKGSPRNLTRTSAFAERTPSWSPDGKWIAYFSDEPGEYEVYVRKSDGSDEPRRLTTDMGPYKNNIWWLPNSESLLYSDKTGTAYLIDLESGERTKMGKNQWGLFTSPSFSNDSRWIAWSAGDDNSPQGRIHLYDTESGETNVVTDSMFSDSAPTFDRAGDYLYFTSQRQFSPSYSDIDLSWIYDDSGVLVAVPLRDDVEHPWLEESDEEEWEEDEEEEEEEEEPAADDDADEENTDEQTPVDEQTDAFSGTWDLSVSMPQVGEISMVLKIQLASDNTLSGTLTSDMFNAQVTGTFDPASGDFQMQVTMDGGTIVMVEGSVKDGQLDGVGSVNGENPAPVTGTRRAPGADNAEDDAEDEEDTDPVEIDLDGFEARSFKLPVSPGNFSNLRVNDRNQLMYVRQGDNGGIKVIDISDEDPSESSAGTGRAFALSADGKKILVPSGSGARIRTAGAGSGGDSVVMEPMLANINPRDEWRQVTNDAWRIQRDYFYDPNLHGVDWEAVRDQYVPMVDQAMTREDVSYIIGEMIGELNVGHAYYWGGDGESQPSRNVGMLGVDWEVASRDPQEWAQARTDQATAEAAEETDNEESEETTDEEPRDFFADLPESWPPAYRVAHVYGGGSWDVDARNPINAQGLDLSQGDFILAVNGVPLDTTRDPWSSFIGTSGRTMVLTVSDKPVMDDDARDIVVKPTGSERRLRYRDWIESNRAKVDELSDGQVGYIYVPNTGQDGQSDLIRQFYGQAHKPALIIDERWNGGGQIPTRFIEMLNRPVTNYWARRDSKDWKWPPDSHQGPKAMLINGMAGSGGDMFPWLFRRNNLGPIIGTRTWGGLVGISGNPRLIDGGYTAVPTFGFYEADGTWGVEGHGVDPDIEVIDDPALMKDGGDPQLERAVQEMLKSLETEAYAPPQRPASPDRSGMGITEEDK